MNTCDIKMIRTRKNRKEKIILAIIILLMLAMIATPVIVAINRQNTIEENYNRSVDMALSGDYEGAAALLDEMEKDWYKDAISIKNFCRACICRDKGLLLNAKYACERLDFNYLNAEQNDKIQNVVESINAESEAYSREMEEMAMRNSEGGMGN